MAPRVQEPRTCNRATPGEFPVQFRSFLRLKVDTSNNYAEVTDIGRDCSGQTVYLVTSDTPTPTHTHTHTEDWIQEFSFPILPEVLDLARPCDLGQGT